MNSQYHDSMNLHIQVCLQVYLCSERKHDLSLDTVGKEKLKKKASDF